MSRRCGETRSPACSRRTAKAAIPRMQSRKLRRSFRFAGTEMEDVFSMSARSSMGTLNGAKAIAERNQAGQSYDAEVIGDPGADFSAGIERRQENLERALAIVVKGVFDEGFDGNFAEHFVAGLGFAGSEIVDGEDDVKELPPHFAGGALAGRHKAI